MCTVQIYNQSAEDGAISLLRAATDPSLTGQGFKYFGAWYKGPLLIHTGNESKPPIRNLVMQSFLMPSNQMRGTQACQWMLGLPCASSKQLVTLASCSDVPHPITHRMLCCMTYLCLLGRTQCGALPGVVTILCVVT